MFYTLDSIKPEKSDWEEYLQEKSEEHRKLIEPRIDDPDWGWDKYWADPNPKVLKEDLYQGHAKRPAYILRGKKVTPEQAFEIIATEGVPVLFLVICIRSIKNRKKNGFVPIMGSDYIWRRIWTGFIHGSIRMETSVKAAGQINIRGVVSFW